MEVYLSLYGHTNQTSLPLRFGRIITHEHQQYCRLLEGALDADGSRQQRTDEINKGRQHYIGTLAIPGTDSAKPFIKLNNCRLVLEPPSRHGLLPRIVTIMGSADVKSDLTVTRHLEGMLKRNQINRDEIVRFFHPAYIEGRLKDSNDCETIRQSLDATDTSPFTSYSSNKVMANALLAAESNFSEAMEQNGDDDSLKAPLTYTKLIVPKVTYQYVMADAYIEDVTRTDSCIELEFINSKGRLQKIRSFPLTSGLTHLKPLHDYAYTYLLGRKKQRAKVAICISDKYKGVFAESVTAIALTLYKNKGL